MEVERERLVRLVLIAIAFIMIQISPVFAKSQINYLGPYITNTSQGAVRVGHFEVNGQTAFCMQHRKSTPPSGTAVDINIYNNTSAKKILYYGKDGPEEWTGFKSNKQGIVLTSLMLTEIYSDNYHIGEFDFMDGMKEFRNYVNSKPTPEIRLNFSESSVKAFYSEELNAERTPNISVTGSKFGELTFIVPEWVILHNNITGGNHNGKVILKAGDSFYLKSINPKSNITICKIDSKNIKFQPLIAETASSNLQNLAMHTLIEDENEITELNVEWIKRGNMHLKKVSENGRIAGIKFMITNISNGMVLYRTTDNNGEVDIEDLSEGQYKIEEIDVPSIYVNPGVQKVEIKENKTAVVNFSNKIKNIDIKIIKKDTESKEPIKGAEFKITDTNYKNKKDTERYVTDRNGEINIKGRLKAGREYLIEETKAAEGYMLSENKKKVKVTGGRKTEVINFENMIQKVYIEVNKTGEKTVISNGRIIKGKCVLENVKFNVIAAEDIKTPGKDAVKYHKNDLVETLVTDNKGHAVTSALLEGRYLLKETETREGYILNGKAQEYNLQVADEKEKKIKTVNIHNKKKDSEFSIVKYDSKTMKRLEGAVFLIINEEEEKLEIMTDKNGKAEISNIPEGKYTYRETKAPDGYKIDKDVYTFEIGKESNHVKAESLDIIEKQGPATGDKNSAVYFLMLVIGLIVLTGVIRHDKL